MEQILTMIFTLTVFSAVFLNTLPYDNPYLDGMECTSVGLLYDSQSIERD